MAAEKTSTLRKTATVAAMMGVGVVAGALLAETSLLNFSLPSTRDFSSQRNRIQAEGSRHLLPVYSAVQGRRQQARRGAELAHHTGI